MDDHSLSLFPELERDLRTLYTTGIVPYQELKTMIDAGYIHAPCPIPESQVQPASIDLRLGLVAYQVRASFLPMGNAKVLSKVDELKVGQLDLSSPTVLQRGSVYIIPLIEELSLPADILGKSNPKSTVGRLDVFTRLITDYGSAFERVPRGYRGALYVEVAPRTFSIVVHAGTRLNQLRFIRGSPVPSDSTLNSLHRSQTLIYDEDGIPGKATISHGLWLSIDLQRRVGSDIVGYRAKQDTPPIDLDRIDYYDPAEFWDAIVSPAKQQIVLVPGEFYILASKEKVRIPPSYAAEMVAYDPSVGEFRIHYAGFFDPGFGYGSDDVKGTRAVLEVRSHEVPFLLRHGQRVGRLIYERLLNIPTKIYGRAIGSSYQGQELSLGKQFRRIPV
ncbi:MAG TPA: 2'-deoxycytidine 5'-triphosphate deaminase [Chloroflexota bacterium]|nr:2'-deoxycytidine 5'-triphosphate deaminase [Chloroflexota bacterium]